MCTAQGCYSKGTEVTGCKSRMVHICMCLPAVKMTALPHTAILPAVGCVHVWFRTALIIAHRLTCNSSGWQRFVPLFICCITSQHTLWTKVDQLSRTHTSDMSNKCSNTKGINGGK